MTNYQYEERSDEYEHQRCRAQIPKIQIQPSLIIPSNPKMMLTQHALMQLAASLPQPISTTRYSNRMSDENKFSDRESEGCPSLSSSPISTNSSTTTVSLATVPEDFLPSRDFKDRTYHLQNNFDSKPATTTYQYVEPDYRSYKYNEPVRTNILDVDFRAGRPERFQPPPQKEYPSPFLEVKKEIKKERKPIVMSFLPARPLKPVVEFADVQTSSPTSTTMFFPSLDARACQKPYNDDNGVDTPPTSPEDNSTIYHDEHLELCPTKREEVKDVFVDTVFTYLSFSHDSIAKSFDDEIAQGSGMTVEQVRNDRKAALKEYIAQYVQDHPTIRAGEGCW